MLPLKDCSVSSIPHAVLLYVFYPFISTDLITISVSALLNTVSTLVCKEESFNLFAKTQDKQIPSKERAQSHVGISPGAEMCGRFFDSVVK